MKTISLSEARSDLSKLIDNAIAGEPSRITRNGKDAVVIVSEAAWTQRKGKVPTLGHLLAEYAEAGVLTDDITNRPWKDRALGNDFD